MTEQMMELTWSNKDLALIPTETGKYDYDWVSPTDPRYCETHTLEITDHVVGTQAPKEDGVSYSKRADFTPTDDNLLILGESGDVLEALTRVPELADKYEGQVKCIYIDPPFNTAQTFKDYEDNLQHSVWLTMMRDRLQHMEKLLSNEGSIWVHLDDVENHRMRLLLDETFGPENFVAEVIWQKLYARKSNNDDFSSNHDTIIIYSKGNPSLHKLPPTADIAARYKNPDNDPRGKWQSVSFSVRTDNPAKRKDYRYEIELPSGRRVGPPEGRHWNGKRNRFEQLLADGLIWFGKDGDSRPREKYFLDTEDPAVVPFTIWPREEVGDNDEAKKGLRKLLPELGDVFDTPKPERLLERILHIATNPGDIVLDVFAGSGTTAAVAQKMGRRWVTCELQEDNFTKFTRPRLEKVVRGEDQGGITTTKGERIPAAGTDLPEGMSAEEAQKFTSLLNKLVRDDDDLKNSAQVKALKALSKTTKTSSTVNWRGGGGFTVARLSPACFDYDERLGTTTLTQEATGETLVNSVCASLRFHRTPEDPVFHGVEGRTRLVVVEGTLVISRVDELITELRKDEELTIAATETDDAVRSYLRQAKRGCRLVHIPSDLFHPTPADTAQED